MKRTTLSELKNRRVDSMTAEEKVAFDAGYESAKLAIEVGEKVRDAREAIGLSQRDLASRMGTSQAAVARLEAGGVGATLTTLHKVAVALDLKVTIELSTAS
jgi:HTH-type transcriptional regulator / antitoxin HipB